MTVVLGPVSKEQVLWFEPILRSIRAGSFFTLRSHSRQGYLSQCDGELVELCRQCSGTIWIYPDENYAREVMQLFTIGLVMLNENGEMQMGPQGAIPTYDADNVREYAEVITDWDMVMEPLHHKRTCESIESLCGTGVILSNASVKYQVPMRMAPWQHDRSTKYLLNGLTLLNPNGTFD